MKKFEYIRSLLIDINSILDMKNIQANEIKKTKSFSSFKDNSKNSLTNIKTYLKNLKKIANIMFIAAKNKQKANLNKVEDLDSDNEDLFIHKQKKEELKEQDIELAIEKQKQKREMSRKFNVFMILWLRQIVVYNTYFVFHLKLTDSYMDSILDIRPSIVKATSIKYALVSLLNPRMRSAKQLRNINSMRRILDNNLTYFFENFLSCKERALACRDLNNLRINHMKINQLKYLNLQPFFESNKEFKKFYSFMDLDYYIENV